MTDEYAENEKVFGRWQPRMLQTHEAAVAVMHLLSNSPNNLDQGLFELNVGGTAEQTELVWARRSIEIRDEESRGRLVFTG